MSSGPTVFISYAHPDTDFAHLLSHFLRANEIDVLSDQSVPVGANFADSLRNEIARADSVVVLMSPDYFSSRWCQAELATAMAERKPVFPIRLRGVPEGPLAFLMYVDGSEPPGEIADRIVDVLETKE